MQKTTTDGTLLSSYAVKPAVGLYCGTGSTDSDFCGKDSCTFQTLDLTGGHFETLH